MSAAKTAFERLCCLPVASALAGALTMTARADANPVARLVYARTPEASSCPSEATLRKSVAARFGYDPFFPWARNSIVVVVARERGRYTTRVWRIEEDGTARGVREISAGDGDCAVLLDTVALDISIALNQFEVPEAAPDPQPTQPPEPAPRDPPPASDRPAKSAPPPARPPEPPPTPPPRAPAGAQVGLESIGASGFGARLSPGVAAYSDVPLRSIPLSVQGDLSVLVSSFGPNDDAQSWLLSATIGPCVHAGVLFACAVGAVGWLSAHGSDVAQPRSAQALLLSGGARAGLDWNFFGRLVFRVHADALVRVNPASFELDHEQVWTLPRVSGVLAGGLGARFP